MLILGGTGFIGPHFVTALKAGGHTITLFNRGKRDPEADPGIEQLIGDRNGQIDALKGRDWDAVIDNSAYTPKQVRLTAELLKGHVKQYILISSVAAYANFAKAGIDESYELAKLDDPTVEEVSSKTYGGLKVLCEQVVEEVYGKQATLIRPTYIAGPGDYTDRFTYWPLRVSKGGEMLAPGTPGDPFQIIDVRDLADFMRVVVEKHLTGAFNLCNPPRSVTMGSVLETSKRVTGADTKFTWASPEFLDAQGLIGKDLFAPSGVSAMDSNEQHVLGHAADQPRSRVKKRAQVPLARDHYPRHAGVAGDASRGESDAANRIEARTRNCGAGEAAYLIRSSPDSREGARCA